MPGRTVEEENQPVIAFEQFLKKINKVSAVAARILSEALGAVISKGAIRTRLLGRAGHQYSWCGAPLGPDPFDAPLVAPDALVRSRNRPTL
jgi:hypothetical protein